MKQGVLYYLFHYVEALHIDCLTFDDAGNDTPVHGQPLCFHIVTGTFLKQEEFNHVTKHTKFSLIDL